jgi:hypothetical protein
MLKSKVMKKFWKIYTNWRVWTLIVLSAAAAFLLLCEMDDDTTPLNFLLAKGIGFGLAYLIYRLGKHWDSKGEINELMELADED